MNLPTRLAAALTATSLMFTLAACGGEGDDAAPSAQQTAVNGDVFTDADVDFATRMIPHHAQALSMVDMTLGRKLSPEVATLAEEIRAAQTPEIEQMTDWLNDWDEPVPETMRDHAHAHGDDTGGLDHAEMPGMMTDEEMSELESAQGKEFEAMWLEMMIEHHEGAVDMAGTELEDGAFEPARELARSIESSQQAEIDQMKSLIR